MTLVWLVIQIVTAYCVGRGVLRLVGPRMTTTVEDLTWSTSLGLGCVALVLTGLGLAGVLYAELIRALTVVATTVTALAGLRAAVHYSGGYRRLMCRLSLLLPPAFSQAGAPGSLSASAESSRADKPPVPPHSPLAVQRSIKLYPDCLGGSKTMVLTYAFGLGAVTSALAAGIGALAPPTAGDALCYHLELPKQFLIHHRLVYLPYSDNSTYPLLMEMLYLWGLALEGGVLAQLLHWLMGILLAGAAVVVAQPVIGVRWAWLAGAIVLLVPGVTNQMTAPLNDLPVAVYATLAVAGWMQGLRTGERRWFVLGGMALGLALGVKYLAILFAAALAGATLLAAVSLKTPFPRIQFRGVCLASGLVIAVGGFWYVRAYRYTGNPVCPFLAEWFDAGRKDALAQRKRPLPPEPAHILAAPWLVTMQPEKFGGRSHQLGAWFLVAVPGWWLVKAREWRYLLAIAGLYSGMWFLLRQNVRFLLPIVPLLSIAVVSIVAALRRYPPLPRAVMIGAFILLAVFSTAIAVRRVRDRVAVAFDRESRHSYLARHEPTYAVARYVNQHLPADAVILSQEHRAYYFRVQVVRENIFRRRDLAGQARRDSSTVAPGWADSSPRIFRSVGVAETAYDRDSDGTGNLPAKLRAAGFTHVLLAERIGPSGPRYDSTLRRLLAPHRDLLRPLYQHTFADAEEGQRSYQLLEL